MNLVQTVLQAAGFNPQPITAVGTDAVADKQAQDNTATEGSGYVLDTHHKTCFTQRDSAFFVGEEKSAVKIHKRLPVGTYVVNVAMTGYYLEKTVDFAPPVKVYGKAGGQATRILNSYRHKTSNLGVILTGEKGSGKSLLARLVCLKALEAGLPVLLITSEHAGKAFSEFLDSIDQECVVFIDEYEKIYSKESQEKMLSLLDGVYQSKKLFVLTCNDIGKIDVNLQNRPGRVHYLLEFSGLDPAFIKEYAEDNLKDKSKVNEVLNVCSMFYRMTFDMLQALIWEVNQYNERPVDALTMLNVKPTVGTRTLFDYTVTCLALGNATLTFKDFDEANVSDVRDAFQKKIWICGGLDLSKFKFTDEQISTIVAQQNNDPDTLNQIESLMYEEYGYNRCGIINPPKPHDAKELAEYNGPKYLIVAFCFPLTSNTVIDPVARIYSRRDTIGNSLVISPQEQEDNSLAARYFSAF